MRLQAKAKANLQSRIGMVRDPVPTVDLPGIIGSTAVVKKGTRSLDGSSANSNSPPADSPPAPYEPPSQPVIHQQGQQEPITPQHNSRVLPDEHWYQPQHQEVYMSQGPPVDVHSHYPSYAPPQEMYMHPTRVVRPQQQDPYAWQRDARSSMVIPNRYHEPQSHHVPHEMYTNMSAPHPYPPYPHSMSTQHQHHPHIPDNHNMVVAPDQNWSIFLGRMGVQ